MKTIKFTAYPDGYRCSEPNDQSGDYVKAEIASSLMTQRDSLLEALKKMTDAFEGVCASWDEWCGGVDCSKCGSDARAIKSARAAIANAERESLVHS